MHVQGGFHDHDPTPRGSNEPWRFTPSLMDPNAFSFQQNYASTPAGYYTPTPGAGIAAPTAPPPPPSAVPGLGTPMSMPGSATAMQAPGMMDMAGFHPLPSHQMHPYGATAAGAGGPFGHQQHHHQQHPQQPQPFVPSNFGHHDTGYETMEQDDSPLNSGPDDHVMNPGFHQHHHATPMMGYHATMPPQTTTRLAQQQQQQTPLHAPTGRFRFHSTLNAPTAMVRQADEIPVTYLNKGQAYSLSIMDSHAMGPAAPGTRFRTFVRVSFEDEEQRQKPGVCWGLWKEGRGANEAHQRGGKLQAVEYVEAGQPVEGDETRTRVEMESSSFDGFSVIWTPGAQGPQEVNVAVRFNFLSTDFSHSKGVKGIPVRLCAKTTPYPVPPKAENQQPQDETTNDPEVCYCKVKLFRDHGAERKLSNDVAHVKKSIDKVKNQIAQAESGLKDAGKRRKAAGGIAKMAADPQRGMGMPKHKRTWSASSNSSGDEKPGGGASSGAGRSSLADDLHVKLQTLQDMFTSTRPVSVLYLRGEDHDDPDAHPVSLPGDAGEVKTGDEASWAARSLQTSNNTGSMVSPSPSSASYASAPGAVAMHYPPHDMGLTGDRAGSDGLLQTERVPRGAGEGWIDALGVDKAYRPPSDPPVPKAVACFYVVRRREGSSTPHEATKDYHWAVYLARRTRDELAARLAAKFGLDPSAVARVVHVSRDGLEVEVDDDVVEHMAEGQDMALEVVRGWDGGMAVDEPDGATGAHLLLRILF